MVTQGTLRTGERNQVFSEEKNQIYMTALDLNKCLRLDYRDHSTRAHLFISELPSNISTMTSIEIMTPIWHIKA